MKNLLRITLITVGVTILASNMFSKVDAASVTVLPSYKDIHINKDKQVETEIFLINNSPKDLIFHSEIMNFGAGDANGGINLGSTLNTNKYNLAEFSTLSTDTLYLKPGAKKSVIVTIFNNSDFSPGGHYGAVVFTLKNPDNSENVAVEQQILSLLFVDKVGGDGAKISTVKIDFARSLFTLPREAEVIIANDGNVHASPEGTLQLKNPRGKILSTSVLNSANGKILPETIRKFVLSISTSKQLYPGRYSIEVMSNGLVTKKTFLYFPPISSAIFCILAIFLGYILYSKRSKISMLLKIRANR